MSSVYKLVGRIVNLGALLGLGRTYSIVIAKQELKTNGNWISPAEVLLHAGRLPGLTSFNVEDLKIQGSLGSEALDVLLHRLHNGLPARWTVCSI